MIWYTIECEPGAQRECTRTHTHLSMHGLQTNNLKIDVEALNKLLASQMFVVPAFQVRQQTQLFPDAWFALTLFVCLYSS